MVKVGAQQPHCWGLERLIDGAGHRFARDSLRHSRSTCRLCALPWAVRCHRSQHTQDSRYDAACGFPLPSGSCRGGAAPDCQVLTLRFLALSYRPLQHGRRGTATQHRAVLNNRDDGRVSPCFYHRMLSNNSACTIAHLALHLKRQPVLCGGLGCGFSIRRHIASRTISC